MSVYRLPMQPAFEYTETYGNSGLNQYNGYINEEQLRELAGIKGVYFYKEMSENDDTVGAVLFLINSLIGQVKFSFEEGKAKDNKSAEVKAFIEEVFDDMGDLTWSTIIEEILTMLPFGFAPMEWTTKWRKGDSPPPLQNDKGEYIPQATSKYNDGRMGFSSIQLRAQETLESWAIDDKNNVLGFWQRIIHPVSRLAFVPAEKTARFVTRHIKNNPEGRAIIRNARRPYLFKKMAEENEAVGIERDLAGLPFVTLPLQMMAENADETIKNEKRTYFNMVRQVKRNQREGIVFPAIEQDGKRTGYDFKLMSTGGTRAINVSEVVRRQQQAIAMTLLAQFLLLGQGSTAHGSFALSSDHTDLFAVALGALLEKISNTITHSLIYPLCKLNGFDPFTWPKSTYGDIETPSLAEMGAFINQCVGCGAIHVDRPLEAHLREIASLPQRDENDVEPASPATVPGAVPVSEKDLKPGLSNLSPLKQRAAVLPLPGSFKQG